MSEFSIDDSGKVIFTGNILDVMKVETEVQFNQNIEAEKIQRVEEEKRRAENLKRLFEEEERKREEHRKHQEEAEKSSHLSSVASITCFHLGLGK